MKNWEQFNNGNENNFSTIILKYWENNPLCHGLSFDIEDYFHVSNFAKVIKPENWHKFASRVERNTEKILQILAEARTFATFFILGWVAERYPNMIKKIHSQGHEIACHGYDHQLIYDQNMEKFQEDIHRSKAILQDITGEKIIGYRAPSYSITTKSLYALDILLEEGFSYDSSIFPVQHHRYGIPFAPRHGYYVLRLQGKIIELPPATLKIGKYNLPIAGGGYFRLYPYWITRFALQKLQKEGFPFIFYLHPWELDPEQPRIYSASWLSRFRHYVNLNTTHLKLRSLLKDFSFVPLQNITQIIQEKNYGNLQS